jgi:hypothetical protein
MSVARPLALVVLLILAAMIILPLVVLWPYLEGQTPEINLARPLTHLGKLTPVGFTVKDEGTGLSLVKVSLVQGTKEIALLDKRYPGFSLWERKGETSAEFNLEVKANELNLAQGPATVTIEARDRSFRGFFHGNVARLELPVVVATIPPRLSVLSRTIHLNRGGVGLRCTRPRRTPPCTGCRWAGAPSTATAPGPRTPRPGSAISPLPTTSPRTPPSGSSPRTPPATRPWPR